MHFLLGPVQCYSSLVNDIVHVSRSQFVSSRTETSRHNTFLFADCAGLIAPGESIAHESEFVRRELHIYEAILILSQDPSR